MSKFFGNDTLFGRFFGQAGNVITMNILFIICSLPIITLGTAYTSMYYALMRSLRYGDTSLIRDFFHSFRKNFRQSALSWLAVLVLTVIFSADIGMFGPRGIYPFLPFYYLFLVLIIIAAITFMFACPVIAAFENTLKNLWIQSFFLAARNLPSALAILILNVVPLYVSLTTPVPQLFGIALFFWIVGGFGFIAWVNTFLFYRIFKPYLPEEPAEKDLA